MSYHFQTSIQYIKVYTKIISELTQIEMQTSYNICSLLHIMEYKHQKMTALLK